MRIAITGALAGALVFWAALPVHALSGSDMQRLLEAGVQAETVAVLVREKAVQRGLLDVDGIVRLKAEGLKDAELLSIVEASSETERKRTIRYTTPSRGLRLNGVDDLLRLQEAGVPAEVMAALVRDRSRDWTVEDRRRAWEMLRGMGVVIDGRGDE